MRGQPERLTFSNDELKVWRAWRIGDGGGVKTTVGQARHFGRNLWLGHVYGLVSW